MRVRARVTGVVQGVGFRPYVHGLATELGLSGFVLNDSLGRGRRGRGRGGRALPGAAARGGAAAGVDRGADVRAGAGGRRGRVRDPREPAAGARTPPIAPDTATCDACLAELFDPADRRYRYPFINCTNCGPRFTIVTGVPYDRPSTTMAGFVMCAACQAEYDDPSRPPLPRPAERLPGVRAARALAGAAGEPTVAAARALLGGAIVAVKGIGGYHLACRADDEDAVARLRARKHREDRPFALMVRDAGRPRAGRARRRCRTPLAARGRSSRAAPARRARRAVGRAALARARRDAPLLAAAPPAARRRRRAAGDDQRQRVRRADRVRGRGRAGAARRDRRPVPHARPPDPHAHRRLVVPRRADLRRSRGYVPATLPVADAPPLLAVGAELKNTFALARDGRAWVGHHIGDLRNYETLRSFTDGIAHFERLFAVEPELVAHDLHPEYLSTKYALDLDLPAVGVQHHHAHLAACLAEHGVPARRGAIYDGTGYGTDGTVWGGEILRGDLHGFERIGHLWPVRMPGGEAAIREPWRMACAWLSRPASTCRRSGSRSRNSPAPGFASPVTTSMGRLFDAVAALCGIRQTVTYEGQAAVELEAAADRERARARTRMRPASTRATPIAAVVRDLARGVDVALVAARFHNAVADATAEALRDEPVVVLSGGVFQNALLLERTRERLPRALVPRGCRSTTAASPTARPRSRRRAHDPRRVPPRLAGRAPVHRARASADRQRRVAGGGVRGDQAAVRGAAQPTPSGFRTSTARAVEDSGMGGGIGQWLLYRAGDRSLSASSRSSFRPAPRRRSTTISRGGSSASIAARRTRTSSPTDKARAQGEPPARAGRLLRAAPAARRHPPGAHDERAHVGLDPPADQRHRLRLAPRVRPGEQDEPTPVPLRLRQRGLRGVTSPDS